MSRELLDDYHTYAEDAPDLGHKAVAIGRTRRADVIAAAIAAEPLDPTEHCAAVRHLGRRIADIGALTPANATWLLPEAAEVARETVITERAAGLDLGERVLIAAITQVAEQRSLRSA